LQKGWPLLCKNGKGAKPQVRILVSVCRGIVPPLLKVWPARYAASSPKVTKRLLENAGQPWLQNAPRVAAVLAGQFERVVAEG